MKKILVSLSIIGVVSAFAIGGTIAYFSDTETSAGNIFVSGTMDLKVDHTRQTYNDADCRTCSVTVKSDPTNIVVAKFGSPVTPYPAVYVGSTHIHNGVGWIHPAWTAQNDPILSAAGAKWIWESDPTRDADLTNNVTYTFRKEFEWWGPITGSDLWLGVGSDNSIKVYLNGILIAQNPMEQGYKKEFMLHIPGAIITDNIIQGNNVLEFEVKNWTLIKTPPATHHDNPAGLIYKFSIDGLCGDDYFKTNCTLWGEKDLASGDMFFNFKDVKPGDSGTNVISLHPDNNDAWACMSISNKKDYENVCIEPETGDETCGTSTIDGELSRYLSTFVWWDTDKDGVFDSGETAIDNGYLGSVTTLPLADASHTPQLTGGETKYIGLAWCFGEWQSIPEAGQPLVCDGNTEDIEDIDQAQTDSFLADLIFYAEQWRNNPNFSCTNVIIP